MSLASLISLLIYLIVIGLVLGLVIWVVDAIPIPAPFNRVIKIMVTAVGVLVVILLLLQMAGLATLPRA